ncbi:unnamed protein product [Blepharisma stoltei]|uniref:Uncharacterized protein n=1 Tax=Blepharisma stoltei TaxID=1481888 RepID=A0AAU9J4E2_9CILI|nr:unnamed protein product [Blepharisma stoltei]
MSLKSFLSNSSILAAKSEQPNEIERLQGEMDIISSLNAYYRLNREFKMIGRPELTERMLRRITKYDRIPKDFQARPLYINLSGIIDELMLNELEIALWAIYLENLVWKNFDTYAERFLLYTAYKAKQVLNEDSIGLYRMYLNVKIKHFEENFQSWMTKYEGEIKVNLKMINEKLNMLKVVKDKNSDYCMLNYNYYVDAILLTAVPYADKGEQIVALNTVEKRKRRELKNQNTNRPKKLKSMKRIQNISKKKMKIEKDGNLINTEKYPENLINNIDPTDKNPSNAINNIDPTYKDPDIAKIEKFCDGLIDYNDLNPDQFFTKY